MNKPMTKAERDAIRKRLKRHYWVRLGEGEPEVTPEEDVRTLLGEVERLELDRQNMQAALATPEMYAGVVSKALEAERDRLIAEVERLHKVVREDDGPCVWSNGAASPMRWEGACGGHLIHFNRPSTWGAIYCQKCGRRIKEAEG